MFRFSWHLLSTLFLCVHLIVFVGLCWAWPPGGNKASILERYIYRRGAVAQLARADEIIVSCERKGVAWPTNASEAFRKQLPWSHAFSQYDVAVFVFTVTLLPLYYLFTTTRGDYEESTNPFTQSGASVFAAVLLGMVFSSGVRHFSTLTSGQRRTPANTVDAIASVLEAALHDQTYDFRQVPDELPGSLAYLSKSLKGRRRFLPRLRNVAPQVRDWLKITEAGSQSGRRVIAEKTVLFYSLYIDGDVSQIAAIFGEKEPRHTRTWGKAREPLGTIGLAVTMAVAAIVAHRQGVPDLVILFILVLLAWRWAERLRIPLGDILGKVK